MNQNEAMVGCIWYLGLQWLITAKNNASGYHLMQIYIKRLGPKMERARRSPGEVRHLLEGKEEDGILERAKEDDKVVEVKGRKTTAEVTDLQLFSRYTVSVTAFNSRGESPASPAVHFSTPEGGGIHGGAQLYLSRIEILIFCGLHSVPGPPASLLFESPSENSMLLHWTPPLQTNGILLGYRVQYQQGKN